MPSKSRHATMDERRRALASVTPRLATMAERLAALLELDRRSKPNAAKRRRHHRLGRTRIGWEDALMATAPAHTPAEIQRLQELSLVHTLRQLKAAGWTRATFDRSLRRHLEARAGYSPGGAAHLSENALWRAVERIEARAAAQINALRAAGFLRAKMLP